MNPGVPNRSGGTQPWLLLALLVGIGWLIWLLAPVITPFAIAAILAYLSDPLVDRLEQLKINRWTLGRTPAVLLVFGLLIAVAVTIVLVLLPLVMQQATHLAQRFPDYLDWATGTALPWLAGQLGIDPATIDTSHLTRWLQQYGQAISGAALNVAKTLGRGGQALIALVTNLVLVPVVTFYLMRDWDVLVSGVRNLLPRSVEPTVARTMSEIDEVLGAFLRGQFIVMLALGLIYAIGLKLIGIEAGFVIGLGAGLLSIVPYLGSITGLAVATGMAVFQYGDALHIVLVLAVFGTGQTLEGMFLTPRLVGDRIGLHPVAVIFAVMAGGQLFGFVGILLALPVAAAVNVLIRHAHSRYRSSSLYGAAQDGPEAP